MSSKKHKWLIYTVVVGLIPAVCRLLIWSVTSENSVHLLSAADFIAFGLVLHISNINEIEHFNDNDQIWKTNQNGISIFFITVYGVLFALNTLSETPITPINASYILKYSVILAFVSFGLSFTVFHRIDNYLRSTLCQSKP